MKFKVFTSLTCCAFLIGGYLHFKKQPPRKASRALASIEKGFDLLSYKELKLLVPQERRDYLNKISQTIVKAGVFKGVFQDSRKTRTSYNKLDFSFGVPKAYAAYHCPMYGMHPFVRGSEAECNRLPRAVKIEAGSENLFASSAVGSVTKDGVSQSIAQCPSGKKMCNPALIGFDFDESGKASLRCLEDASNANCFKERTNAEQMGKSLEILEQANPRYWNEFARGIEEQCLKDGEFNSSDEGCEFARKQMNYSTRTYRNRLTQKYKDLAAKLNEQIVRDSANGKACQQFTKTESETGLADHENFNAPGFKIMYKRGQCWRVPTRSVVKRTTEKYEVLLPEGDGRSDGDPNATAGDPSVVLIQDIGGLGNLENRVGDARFYNFQCGPCNDAVSISACVFNMRKPEADRNYERIDVNRVTALGTDDCRALIEKLENTELPDVVFEKAQQQGTPFYQSDSID